MSKNYAYFVTTVSSGFCSCKTFLRCPKTSTTQVENLDELCAAIEQYPCMRVSRVGRVEMSEAKTTVE